MARQANNRNSQQTSKNHILPITTLTALGVVYGDIGTSPLYAVRECFHGPAAVALTPANVLGVLSLVLWSLILVISVKYLAVVMRADNQGEGGILALLALLLPRDPDHGNRKVLLILGLFGAGLLYGDGMITPAISVLSAVEGLHVATPAFEPYVVPITLGILLALFLVQRHGTAGIGVVFGPVMLVWFVTIAGLGIAAIVREPGVLAAISPHHAAVFFLNNQWQGFIILGLIFLVVTGGEALYADMGHFGIRPIRIAWFFLVLPALLLNYFGQGALLLRDPDAMASPFYHLAADWAKYPLVVLATAATVIASQAVISGSFSLARQAARLGYSPRLRIVQTSSEERGQVYVPAVNWALFVTVMALVLAFRSSSNLAAAYGMAVTTTMVITTILLYVVARERWRWRKTTALAVMGVFLTIDVAFFSANLVKVLAGGWLPLLVGATAGTLMTTWKRGRQILAADIADKILSPEALLEKIEAEPPVRVPGCAVFLSAHPHGIPMPLIHNLQHNIYMAS